MNPLVSPTPGGRAWSKGGAGNQVGPFSPKKKSHGSSPTNSGNGFPSELPSMDDDENREDSDDEPAVEFESDEDESTTNVSESQFQETATEVGPASPKKKKHGAIKKGAAKKMPTIDDNAVVDAPAVAVESDDESTTFCENEPAVEYDSSSEDETNRQWDDEAEFKAAAAAQPPSSSSSRTSNAPRQRRKLKKRVSDAGARDSSDGYNAEVSEVGGTDEMDEGQSSSDAWSAVKSRPRSRKPPAVATVPDADESAFVEEDESSAGHNTDDEASDRAETMPPKNESKRGGKRRTGGNESDDEDGGIVGKMASEQKPNNATTPAPAGGRRGRGIARSKSKEGAAGFGVAPPARGGRRAPAALPDDQGGKDVVRPAVIRGDSLEGDTFGAEAKRRGKKPGKTTSFESLPPPQSSSSDDDENKLRFSCGEPGKPSSLTPAPDSDDDSSSSDDEAMNAMHQDFFSQPEENSKPVPPPKRAGRRPNKSSQAAPPPPQDYSSSDDDGGAAPARKPAKRGWKGSKEKPSRVS